MITIANMSFKILSTVLISTIASTLVLSVIADGPRQQCVGEYLRFGLFGTFLQAKYVRGTEGRVSLYAQTHARTETSLHTLSQCWRYLRLHWLLERPHGRSTRGHQSRSEL